ncbi:hypothetical protein MKX08_007692 [Trichoderma sp. CBMAI-0020]|nr:hypothetical protein MKX08_007692 [Trichoderma sp. CBMAI-0020]
MALSSDISKLGNLGGPCEFNKLGEINKLRRFTTGNIIKAFPILYISYNKKSLELSAAKTLTHNISYFTYYINVTYKINKVLPLKSVNYIRVLNRENLRGGLEQVCLIPVLLIIWADSLHAPLFNPRDLGQVYTVIRHLRAGNNNNTKTTLLHLCHIILNKGYATKTAISLSIGKRGRKLYRQPTGIVRLSIHLQFSKTASKEAYITKATGDRPLEPMSWACPAEVKECYPKGKVHFTKILEEWEIRRRSWKSYIKAAKAEL